MSTFKAKIDSIDSRVDQWFDRLRGVKSIDRMFYTASFIGDHGAIWIALALLRGVVDSNWYVAGRALIAIPCESILVNGIIKSFFRRTRPVHQGERPYHLRTPRTSSFPSGHATSAFTAATLLSFRSDYAIALYALATIIAFSRVHVRIHHASDVIGGITLGLMLGISVRILAF